MTSGNCARVLLDGQSIGFVGELHPQWRQSWELAQVPVLFELDLHAVQGRAVPRFKPVSKHQSVERDLAVVVAESVTHADIMASVRAALPGTLLRDAVLFDVYRPKPVKNGAVAEGAPGLAAGEKSLAVRLTLGGDANLTDTEIDTAMQAVLARLVEQVGARLRV